MTRKRKRGRDGAPAPITDEDRRKQRMKEREGRAGAAPPPESTVFIRRRPNDESLASIEFNKLGPTIWSNEFGGYGGAGEEKCVRATVVCSDVYDVTGSIHTGIHGPCPHNILVVVLEQDNPRFWEKIHSQTR